MKKLFAAAALAAVLPLAAANPKYIFLFIGDGMGAPQVALATEYARGKLTLGSLPTVGVTATRSLNRFITDSAAAGTALAAGEKTNSGMIGQSPDGRRLESYAAEAVRRGKKIGVVTSVSLDHATPAAFYAHVPSRSSYYDIACQMAQSDIDYLAGGGLLQPKGKDGRRPDAYELARKNGYTVARTVKEFEALKPGIKAIAVAPNPTRQASLQYEIDRAVAPNPLTLADFTRKGIELLQNPNGFFLMVEGGMIDWACHANDAAAAVQETIAFDRAINVAVEFAERHPGETLIVITADHETGGLTLGHGQTPYLNDYSLLDRQKLSFQKFSAEVKKRKRSGLSFAEACKLVETNYGLDYGKLTTAEQAALKQAWEVSTQKRTLPKAEADELYGGYEPIAAAANRIFAAKAGLGWSTYAHTALPVLTAAIGVNSEKFTGRYDNTVIARLLREMLQ